MSRNSWGDQFKDMAFEYMAYVDGKLVEKRYGSGIKSIRDRLRYLLRKYDKLVFYQVVKLSHKKQGTERRSWETGWVDLDCRFNKTTTYHNYQRKTPTRR